MTQENKNVAFEDAKTDRANASAQGTAAEPGAESAETTAGGREGTFSFEDKENIDEVDAEWSPGTKQPKA